MIAPLLALACIAFFISSSTSLFAQVDISALLVGSVTDQTGAVIPNAIVVARNVETGVEAKATSNGSGYYRFVSLPVGTYTVNCSLDGFKMFRASDVILHARDTVNLPVTLQIGSANQIVNVSGSSALVDTETAKIQTTFDSNLIKGVPVEGRDPRESLELLMPGATAAGTGASYNVPVTSFNGVSGLSNNYSINGSSVVDYVHGSATPFPQSENIAEFSVSTSLPDASVARGAGGQVEAVMKSGTNDLHGQGWAYFQNSAWNANSWQNNWQGVARQPFSQRWYGGNVGGPVLLPKLYNGKNKTFFFTSYERTGTSKRSTTTGQTITDEERNGNFTNSPDGIPVINGVPTPIIPVSDFSTLGQLIHSGTSVLPAPTSGLDTFTWNPNYSDITQTFTGRIDENFSDKHRLLGSLWWYNDNPTFDDMYDEFSEASWATHYPNPDATWGEPKKMQAWTLNDTYAISPKMLNNFIVGVTRINISVTNTWTPGKELFGAGNTGIGAVGDVEAPDVQQITFPRAMGMGLYNGYVNPLAQNVVDLSDNFTLTAGRHTLKAGVEIRQFHEVFDQTWGAGGGVSFSDSNINVGGTGNGIADMLLKGGVGSFAQNNTQALDILYPAREAYVQDTIKLTPRLTAMIGARWEPHFGIQPVHDNFVTFHPGQASTVFPTAPVGLVTIGDRGVPKNLYGVRWGDVGPRVSFAWDILGNGKAALKGGYGMYSNYQVLLGFNGYTNTAPYGVNYSPNIQKLDLANPYVQYGSVPFPFKAPAAGAPGNNTLVFPNPVNTLAMAQNYNSGRIHEFNVTFEIEPVNSYLVSVAWVGTRGTHLDETYNYNWPRFIPGESTNEVTNIYSRQPYFADGFNSINMDASDYNSMYNALQVRVNKRYSYGLTFMGNYTYSTNATQNGCRYQADCGLDYYSPGAAQAMAVAFRYALPGPHNQSWWIKRILGGWYVGGTINGNTGAYGSIGDYNCSEFNFGSAGCNATYTGGGALLKSRGQVARDPSGTMIGLTWIDPNKFVRADQVSINGVPTTLPSVGQRLFLGNATTGIYKGPAGIMFNSSLDKDFDIVKECKLNFHIEAFNTLNHTVLNAPNYNNTVGPNMLGFGVINSAQSPRNIQLSAHILF
ncbi:MULTISPECIES: carboxypeptidase-like regulatory domain-containing protein [Acidobacteriaceae]|uniref:carboxypeptidase-like regulatory domain-containing protein n=1 Tax=Acidobacteriaceae TaxID=204434 RepID=UPI00131D4180|nr:MULTISPECIES: carboxypeptidase-like regulatory domain-containing protein [Acidobacteriaceae]MDW5267361.1 carboxypeptidase-like regulatory domain-containing protein [Edaphobacter sp.]